MKFSIKTTFRSVDSNYLITIWFFLPGPSIMGIIPKTGTADKSSAGIIFIVPAADTWIAISPFSESTTEIFHICRSWKISAYLSTYYWLWTIDKLW